MTFVLTDDENKVAKCGSIDFTKFTDATKGWSNIQPTEDDEFAFKGITFIAQDVLDLGFTKEQAKTIIENLTTKGVILSIYVPVDFAKNIKTDDYKKFIQDLSTKQEDINGNWMFMLTEKYINYIASQK